MNKFFFMGFAVACSFISYSLATRGMIRDANGNAVLVDKVRVVDAKVPVLHTFTITGTPRGYGGSVVSDNFAGTLRGTAYFSHDEHGSEFLLYHPAMPAHQKIFGVSGSTSDEKPFLAEGDKISAWVMLIDVGDPNVPNAAFAYVLDIVGDIQKAAQ